MCFICQFFMNTPKATLSFEFDMDCLYCQFRRLTLVYIAIYWTMVTSQLTKLQIIHMFVSPNRCYQMLFFKSNFRMNSVQFPNIFYKGFKQVCDIYIYMYIYMYIYQFFYLSQWKYNKLWIIDNCPLQPTHYVNPVIILGMGWATEWR